MLDYSSEALEMGSRVGRLRNRLIHGHDNVDFDILWQIVTQDLPVLTKELESIVPPL